MTKQTNETQGNRIKSLGHFSGGEVVLSTASINFNGSFLWALKGLKKNGYKVISAEELVKARVEGIDGIGGIVSGMGLYFPKEKKIFVTKDYSFECYAIKNGWSSGNKVLSANLEDLRLFKENALEVNLERYQRGIPNSNNFPIIPISNFGKDPLSKYLFGNSLKEYEEFLINKGVKKLTLDTYDVVHKSYMGDNPFICPIGMCHGEKPGIRFSEDPGDWVLGIKKIL